MQRLIDIYIDCFAYDVAAFSNPWLYVFVIPIIFYLWFFVVKWLILTLPIWLPLSIIASRIPRSKSCRK